jgi:hypothetical protein
MSNAAADHRVRRLRRMPVLDFRRYRRHRGRLLRADRVFVRGIWTPVVLVRVHHPRAADGATEI